MAKPSKEMINATPDAKRSLMRAAMSLFAQQGFSATGVQQITDAAGVNKAMLYYYFVSKEGLYDLLVTDGIRAMESAVSAAEMSEGTIRERLLDFLMRYFSIVDRQPDLARILFRETMGGGERARQTVVDHLSGVFHRLSVVLQNAAERSELHSRTDSMVLAYSLFGMATMFIASHFVTGRSLDTQQLSNDIIDLFLGGAGNSLE
ncbi:MAG TPA: TetR/AcrR family transcriptional regulator [Armatimonadota bacterium]|nr:TetR/AcrR family transcriptional regulator [Armatimonadota bacterium]